MRKTSEELQQIMKKENVSRIWSWSRFNSFHNSPYEYYLRYIKKEKEDRQDSIYVSTGGISHNILEKFYLNKIKYDEMLGEFKDGWTVAFDISDLKFNRTDEESNQKISDNYYADLKHFFTHHKVIKGNILIEQFIKTRIGNSLFQGYIDVCFKDEKGIYHILDWKTSSIYKGKKAENECGQLLVYAIGLNQAGIPFDKIRIGWDFLKYTNVYCYKPNSVKLTYITYKGEEKVKDKLDEDKIGSTLKATVKTYLKKMNIDTNYIDSILEEFIVTNDINVLPKEIQEKIHIEYLEDDDKPRQIERCKIGESLQTDCKRQMKKLGYSDEQISYYLRLLLVTNDIECLPKDVQDKYVFEDCYVEVPITEELINYWTDNIITTINDIELREKDYDETHSDKAFWDSEEQVKAQSFYFANLCSYSRFKHKPYDEYLKKQEQLQTERDNLYKNVGVQSSDYEVSNSDTEYDLSWLDDLV